MILIRILFPAIKWLMLLYILGIIVLLIYRAVVKVADGNSRGNVFAYPLLLLTKKGRKKLTNKRRK